MHQHRTALDGVEPHEGAIAERFHIVTAREMGEALVSGRCPKLKTVTAILRSRPSRDSLAALGVTLDADKLTATRTAVVRTMGTSGMAERFLSFIDNLSGQLAI